MDKKTAREVENWVSVKVLNQKLIVNILYNLPYNPKP